MKPNLRGKKQVKPLSKAEWSEILSKYGIHLLNTRYEQDFGKLQHIVNSALRKRGK